MKKNNFLVAIATLISTLQVSAFVPMPQPPNYKNCPIVQTSVVTNSPDGSTKTETRLDVDQSCVDDANRQYSAMQTANALANKLDIDSNDRVMAPTKPVYECTKDSAGNFDYACLNRDASKQRGYEERLSIYNKFKEEESRTVTQQQSNFDARSKGSVTEHLATAEAKALEGEKDQSKRSALAMAASITLAAYFAASCPKCQYKFAIASAVAARLSKDTAQQAARNQQMAYDACDSYNKMASEKKECGVAPPAFDPDHVAKVTTPAFPFGQVDSGTGKCLPAAPSTCQSNLDDLNRQGFNIQDILKKGPSTFAGPNAPFKLNTDGSVTLKNGKTYRPEDFASKESMIAAGMSVADAQAVANDLYGKDGALARAGLNPKTDLADLPKSLGTFDMSAGGSSTVKGATDESEKLGLGSKDINGSVGSKARKPTTDSEGLVRDFNGDSIGISNDNIFKMMNKRYILKSAQDSFIGQ